MIDVVIVHYSSSRELQECVSELHRDRSRITSTVIVDNRSPEPAPDSIGELATVVHLDENLGFARAANIGAETGCAEYVLFLNPDVRVSPGLLPALSQTLGRPDVAAVSPTLVLPDGSLQVGMGGCLPGWGSLIHEHLPIPRRGGRRLFISPPHPRRTTPGEAVEVDWLCGACLLVRRSDFERVNGFDGRFFLYGEDIDLGHRLRARGRTLLLRSDMMATHGHVAHPGGSEHRASATAWLDGLDEYYRKHAPRSRRCFHAIAAVGFGLRAIAYRLGLADPRSPAVDATRRVWTYARRSLALSLAP